MRSRLAWRDATGLHRGTARMGHPMCADFKLVIQHSWMLKPKLWTIRIVCARPLCFSAPAPLALQPLQQMRNAGPICRDQHKPLNKKGIVDLQGSASKGASKEHCSQRTRHACSSRRRSQHTLQHRKRLSRQALQVEQEASKFQQRARLHARTAAS